ncbi:hypothetical protein HDU76_007803 [Blyttiomyces sp. JEL0837]|nr:hypothetical protein HDU76_007803 [Blyttiomyces sp. JEL0837]
MLAMTLDEETLKELFELDNPNKPYCANTFKRSFEEQQKQQQTSPTVKDEEKDKKDQPPQKKRKKSQTQNQTTTDSNCSFAKCRLNPNCVNNMGQNAWLGDGLALKLNKKIADQTANLTEERRPMDIPSGLKNLAATCYVNALLQVLFHNPDFRRSVYRYRFDHPDDVRVSWVHTSVAKRILNQQQRDNVMGELQRTFARMHLGQKRVCDPTNFVRALDLDHSTQQDAEEFNNLFMSAMDQLFSQQRDEALRNTVSELFEGLCRYVTTCCICKKKSCRDEKFRQLDLHIKEREDLHDYLQTYLKEEVLDNDNLLWCSDCQRNTPVTRKIELLELPPVLNIHLMRFEYDPKTNSKKKIAYPVRFPRKIDMRQMTTSATSDSNLNYELSAVLMHRGPSAHHGHFVATLWSQEQSKWFYFNDEEVQALDVLHFDEDGRSKKASSDDSFSSKSAYILVYRRQDNSMDIGSDSTVEVPEAMKAEIQVENSEFQQMEKETTAKLTQRADTFAIERQSRIDLFLTCHISSAKSKVSVLQNLKDTCYHLPAGWLRSWIKEDIEHIMDQSELSEFVRMPDMAPLMCEHGKLAPSVLGRSKRISSSAMDFFKNIPNIKFEITLSNDDYCMDCAQNIVNNRIHSTNKKEQAFPIEWMKMKNSTVDLNPSSPEWIADVTCDHGKLSVNETNRRLVNEDVFLVLSQVTLDMVAVPEDSAEVCSECAYNNEKELQQKDLALVKAANEKVREIF